MLWHPATAAKSVQLVASHEPTWPRVRVKLARGPGLLLLLASLLRFLGLENIPYLVDGNASELALGGIEAWQNGLPVFATGWEANQNLYFYLHGLALKLFGETLFGTRVLAALGGVLAVAAVYFLAKELFGQRAATVAGLFTAISPIHLVFSRNGMELIHVTYFGPLILLFLYKGFKDRRSLFFLIAGVLLGLSQYFAHIARFFPFLALAAFLILTITFRDRIPKKQLFLYGGIFTLASLATYAPMLAYYLQDTNAFLQRILLEGEGGIPVDFLERFVKAFLVLFLPLTNRRYWFYFSAYLEPAGAVLFALGLLWAIRKIRDWKIHLLLVWLILGLVMGSVLTKHSPSPNRYLVIFPAIAILASLGLRQLSEHFPKLRKPALAMLAIGGLAFYWYHEQVQTFRYNIHTQVASFAGRYLRDMNFDHTTYFVGNEILYFNAVPSLEYLSREEGTDILDPIEDFPFNFPDDGVFIILPARSEEIPDLMKRYPQGRAQLVTNRLGTELFYLFIGDAHPTGAQHLLGAIEDGSQSP